MSALMMQEPMDDPSANGPDGRSTALPQPLGVDEPQAASPRLNAAQKLLAAASKEVALAQSKDGTLMAALARQPHLMYAMAGPNPRALVPVFLQYFAENGKPAPKDAIAQVRSTLEMEASTYPPITIQLRAAREAGEIWLDTGWDDGSVIHVTASGWTVESSCPVHFRRSQVTASLADPRHVESDLSRLSRYVHCSPEDLPLVYAVLVTTWFSDVPQPVFSLFGPADSGKTTAMRFLLDLVDPSHTQAGGVLDKDPRNLKAVASIRRVMCFDNASRIDGDTSDLLARISTGGELVSRALYTDDQAHITELLRPVWLNGIMSGFTRGDLASRAVSVDLLPVPADERVAVEDLNRSWQQDRPAILAGLLDLAVAVLASRAEVAVTGAHRNAEFERNLIAIDALLGTDGAGRLAMQAQALSEAVLDATTFGMAFRRAVTAARAGRQPSLFHFGSAADACDDIDGFDRDEYLFQRHTTQTLMYILKETVDEKQQRDLPQTSKAFGEALTRHESVLRTCLSIEIDRSQRKSGQRFIIIRDLLT